VRGTSGYYNLLAATIVLRVECTNPESGVTA
jgi:hypothetical protein